MVDAKRSFTKDIPAALSRDPGRAREVDAIVVFKISGKNGGTWTLDLKDELGVTEGDHAGADCTISLSDVDWEVLTKQPGAAMQFFLDGRLHISGNGLIATRLQSVLG